MLVNQHFLLFPQCFLPFPTEFFPPVRIETFFTFLFTTQSQLLTTLRKKPFENMMGKGENAGNQHFFLFPQCFLPFPKEFFSHVRIEPFFTFLFTTQSRLLTTPRKKPFENMMGKGENAGNQHFFLFPQCFLPFPKEFFSHVRIEPFFAFLFTT